MEPVCRPRRISGQVPLFDQIGLLPQRARFHWLTAKRSAVIQTSQVHMGRCGDMDAIVEHLMDRMVRVS